MRSILFISVSIILSLTLFGCDQSESETAEDISTNELQEMLSQDYQFVDIRTAGEYNDGHIKEFNENIDYYQFKDNHTLLDHLDKEKPIVIICRSGSRSGRAKNLLSDLGFTEIYNVTGGISSWEGNLVN